MPTKYGYSAVVLPPYSGAWELSSPVELPDDLLIQLRGQILHTLAIYCSDLSEWAGQLPSALLWAGWGASALLISSLWDYGAKYVLLYFWIRIFFFADGIRLLSQILFHIKGLLRVRRIRRGAVRGQWVSTNVEMPRKPLGETPMSERDFIHAMSEMYPQTKPYYDEMLRREPPWLFSAIPLGPSGLIRYMFVGRRVPRPILIFELGELR